MTSFRCIPASSYWFNQINPGGKAGLICAEEKHHRIEKS